MLHALFEIFIFVHKGIILEVNCSSEKQSQLSGGGVTAVVYLEGHTVPSDSSLVISATRNGVMIFLFVDINFAQRYHFISSVRWPELWLPLDH